MSNKLSVVMSFLNEKEEVGRTIQSIRETAGNNVDIVVVNDASDDGYDYAKDIANYNVKYHVNSQRIGAAQGKELAVQLCDTPYFIILDAHMRFYDTTWANKLITELDSNPNQLICCQTKVLSKQDDGTLIDKGEMGVYGAYVTFSHEELIPNIKWNSGNIATSLTDKQIPAVLGASYCTSKTYWNKLKGLQGLIHYGCEEAYISLKAWLEGGGCKLIDSITIGHIYREKPPYHIDTIQNNYNYYLIANTLFPTFLKAKAHATGLTLNKQLYLSVQDEIKKHSSQIARLRQYYSKTLCGNTFSYVAEINDVLSSKDAIILKEEEHRLGDVISSLKNTVPRLSDINLFHGQCGAMLPLALYAHLYCDQEADRQATILFNNILNTLSSDIPITFHHGLCGIGWAMALLVSQGVITFSDIQTELHTIDSLVVERSPRRVADLTLSTGIGGILAYILSRISINPSPTPPFDHDYLKELYEASLRLHDTEIKDWRTLTMADCFIDCYRHNTWLLTTPQPEDLFELPTFLPKEQRYQKHGLDGSSGFALFLINRQQRAKRFRLFNK